MKLFVLIIFAEIFGYAVTRVIVNDDEKVLTCETFGSPSEINSETDDSNNDRSASSLVGDILSPDLNDLYDEKSTFRICPPRHFCFAVWTNDSKGNVDLKRKGCFTNHEVCIGKRACVTSQQRQFFFCCCDEDMCNHDFLYEPDLFAPSEPTEETSSVVGLPAMYLVVTIILCFLVIALTAFFLTQNRYVDVFKTKVQQFEFRLRAQFEFRLRSQPSSPLLEPERSPIEFLELKAEGRCSRVWKARYGNEIVAVKVLPFKHQDLWKREKDIFKLPQMNHENILKFIAAEHFKEALQPGYWLITVYQEIGSLYDYLKCNTVTYEQLCHISFNMARGLAHLHAEIPSTVPHLYKPSIAHRDLKSANILLKADFSTCIADFGLALTFYDNVCDLQMAQIQVGTKRYMAPELLDGAIFFSSSLFLQIDIYALALILWELLSRCSLIENDLETYKRPFDAELGENPNLDALRDFVVHKKGRPVLKHSWRNHPALSEVCDITEECWDHEVAARLSAACVTERFSAYVKSDFTPCILTSENSQS